MINTKTSLIFASRNTSKVTFCFVMSNKELCERDLSILDLLFDQTKCEKDVKDFTHPVNDEIDVKDGDEESSIEILRSKALEVEGVKLVRLLTF